MARENVDIMRTFVVVTLSSEGAPASQVTQKLQSLGFKTQLGNHDFVYYWDGDEIQPDQVIAFVEKVQESLKGMNVMLQFATTP